ncbi:molecular chaperone [Citrobacter amalonaticus]|nr:molecular chaperone [Citrobacter amalonaticus]
MFRTANFAFLLLLIGWMGSSYAGGIVLERTRVIYDASKKEAALPLANRSEEMPYLLQSWVENVSNGSRGPFIVTPPLFRLDAGEDSTLRIVKSDALIPEEKESLYFINVRAIPAQKKTEIVNTNALTLVFKTRIKMFYRPKGLKGRASDAVKKLEFSITDNQLTIYNPSSYYVVFAGLSFGKTDLTDKIEYIAPLEKKTLTLASAAGKIVKWVAINDYGGTSQTETRSLL